MAASYHDRQRATANIGHALRATGWALLGYKADKSDSMTDYFDPAAWDGLARKDGVLALVDVGPHHAKTYTEPQPIRAMADGPCSSCAGTGKERRDVAPVTMMSYPSMVKTTTPGCTAGDPCRWCEGTGRREEMREVGQTTPLAHVRPCVGRWVVIREADGRVLGTGQRSLECGDYHHDAAEVACAQAVRDIEAAAFTRTMAHRDADELARLDRKAAETSTTADGATVRPSTVRAGYVEVVHGSKPPVEVRDELKAAGFRWAVRSSCWYGPAERLPARYGTRGPQADRAVAAYVEEGLGCASL